MTEVLQWAIGLLVTVDISVTAFLAHLIWTHVVECKHVTARLATLEADMNRAKEDIGTTDTGMRGHIHEIARMCQKHQSTLEALGIKFQ